MKKKATLLSLVIASVPFLVIHTASGQWLRVAYSGDLIGPLHAKGDTLLAGRQQDVLRSTDGGETWVIPSQLPTLSVAAFAASADTFLVSTDRERGCLPGMCDPVATIFRSTDGGATWDSVLAAVNGAKSIRQTSAAFYADPDGALFLSLDGGRTWEEGNLDTAASGPVELVFTHGDTLYVDTREQALLKSMDGGESWSGVNNGLPGTAVFAMTALNEILYSVPAVSGIYRSSDYGVTWNAINDGIGQFEAVHSVLATTFGIAAAAVESVYFLPLGESLWRNISEGLRPQGSPFIASLAVTDEYLFAGTNDGIWRRRLSDFVTSVQEDGKGSVSFFLHQNHPNPFNPITVIGYQLPVFSVVKLSIYDVLGREVAVLVEEEKAAGSYRVKWDATDFPSGMYFARFEARQHRRPTVVSEKKMVLMK